jgi:hypothetical protein
MGVQELPALTSSRRFMSSGWNPSRQRVSTEAPRGFDLCVKTVPPLVGGETSTTGGMACRRALNH